MDNIIVDHSDVIGASPVGCRRCSNYISILDLTPSFSGLGKHNYKTRWEVFELGAAYIRGFTVITAISSLGMVILQQENSQWGSYFFLITWVIMVIQS